MTDARTAGRRKGWPYRRERCCGDGVLPDGHTETVTTTVAEVRPRIYLTSWQEWRGTRVLHLEDFERGRVHSRRAFPDYGGGEFAAAERITSHDFRSLEYSRCRTAVRQRHQEVPARGHWQVRA
ncbi:MoaF-related domain-containing protein [Streptomyces sp. E-15]